MRSFIHYMVHYVVPTASRNKPLGNKIWRRKPNLSHGGAVSLEPPSQSLLPPPRLIFLWVLQRGMEDKWIAISSVLITCRELLCSSIKQFFPPLVKCNLVTQWTKKKPGKAPVLFWSLLLAAGAVLTGWNTECICLLFLLQTLTAVTPRWAKGPRKHLK